MIIYNKRKQKNNSLYVLSIKRNQSVIENWNVSLPDQQNDVVC